MADKILKYLNKISDKDKKQIEKVLLLISAFNFKNLDIKKLSTFDNKYRVRVGSHRIIFTIENNLIIIEQIKKRDENTY